MEVVPVDRLDHIIVAMSEVLDILVYSAVGLAVEEEGIATCRTL